MHKPTLALHQRDLAAIVERVYLRSFAGRHG